MSRRKAASTAEDINVSEERKSLEGAEKRSLISSIFSSSKRVFVLCLVMRMINSLLVQTYFNPDEHWQALEVAHRITFGYGHLTWEWKKGIRSYLHPMMFAALYKVLALLHLDIPILMIKAPRMLQSILSAFGDLYLYKFSRVLFGNHVAQWALFAQLTNWFVFYCTTRTLSNSLETVLTLVGLYYWPCLRTATYSKVSMVPRKYGLAAAALACALRPTSAITWIYVGLLELIAARDRLKFIFLEAAPIGGLVLGFTCLLDRLMYGSWVLVPLNFLKFNFLSSGGDYYGTHKWHWYFTQGFSVMLFTFIPFSIYGIILSKQWKLSGLIIWVLGLYSVLGHKEFSNIPDTKRKLSPSKCDKRSLKSRLAIFFLLATNVPMALYMSMVHQRGAEEIMNYLSQEANSGKVESVLFLTPCHATPYYSTLHQNVPMRLLDCSPSDTKGIPDESDRFMMDPAGFALEFAKNWSVPSHIVLFDSQERLLKDFLALHSFQENRRFFHSHFKVDRDLQASIVVYTLES
ncbi:mannosyltransferase APTG1-like isoform X2 [Apium graveolens]|uniref:mannosyltransferase APTG1-like isoform X2 n=1 Tax=Apium graveolens TaxID=4045 RepID=UPI003D79B268